MREKSDCLSTTPASFLTLTHLSRSLATLFWIYDAEESHSSARADIKGLLEGHMGQIHSIGELSLARLSACRPYSHIYGPNRLGLLVLLENYSFLPGAAWRAEH